MVNSGDNETRHPANPIYNPSPDYDGDNQIVVSALFSDTRSASAAIRELRDIGVPAGNISMISRDEDNAPGEGLAGAPGMAREEVSGEGLTYRASPELPNDEELPTTAVEMTGNDMPIVTDWEVPPNEPLGGSDRLGLPRDDDKVRRNEAETNADEDIYTDFPDQPGGVSPDSPAAESVAANIQESSGRRTNVGSNAAAGAGIGAVAGLLAGLAGLAIPGIGPFIAAGPLAGILSGIVTGGAAGGIIGALSGIGVPDEYAREYAAGIEQGQTLVSVRTDNLSRDPVERVLTANGGEQVR
jgi:TM2 domain-containing membrane protein YozV